MPRSARLRSALSKATARSRPSASSVSAAPALLEAARLPCLATGTPQAATTMATAVETLRLWLPSPPVPQTSIAPGGAVTGFIRIRIASAAAAISVPVSPRSAMVLRKAAISSSATRPSNMAAKAVKASASSSGTAASGRAVMSALSPSCRRSA